MDKSIWLIMVAIVAVVAAVFLIFMLQGEAKGFGDFSDKQKSDAQCTLWHSEWASGIYCKCESVDGTEPGQCSEDGDAISDRSYNFDCGGESCSSVCPDKAWSVSEYCG